MNTPELLRSIANDIRTHGHYQSGKQGSKNEVYGLTPFHTDLGDVGCCVLYNPTVRPGGNYDPTYADEVTEMLYQRLSLSSFYPAVGVVSWNDSTPTDEVLAALERYADELEAAEHADA